MTFNLCFRAMLMIGSMSAGCPYRCTGMMAFVFDVIAASMLPGAMLNVSGSGSTGIGRGACVGNGEPRCNERIAGNNHFVACANPVSLQD